MKTTTDQSAEGLAIHEPQQPDHWEAQANAREFHEVRERWRKGTSAVAILGSSANPDVGQAYSFHTRDPDGFHIRERSKRPVTLAAFLKTLGFGVVVITVGVVAFILGQGVTGQTITWVSW